MGTIIDPSGDLREMNAAVDVIAMRAEQESLVFKWKMKVLSQQSMHWFSECAQKKKCGC